MLLPRSDPRLHSCDGLNPPCAYGTNIPDRVLNFPGSYGYMGFTMVAIFAVVVCVVWLYAVRQKAKRAMMREANDTKPKAPTSKTPWRSWFGIGRRKSLSPSSPVSCPNLQQDAEGSLVRLSTDIPKRTNQAQMFQQGKQPRWVSQSGVRKDLVKEVSGGMVVYTAPNRGTKPARPKPTAQPPRGGRHSSILQMEHVHGVRYQVSLFEISLPSLAGCLSGENTTRGCSGNIQ